MAMTLNIRTIVSMPFEENTYVLTLPGRTDAVIIDPGFEPELITEALADEALTVAAILNTHGHADHIAGNEAMKRAFPQAPLVIGHGDAPMLTDADLNLSAAYGVPITSPPADQTVREGETITFGGIDFEVLEVPGHSPGHVVFVVRTNPITIIGGDVLFRESIGRTDFPGGSFDLLKTGIHTKLWLLPDATIVYPGHGPVTTIGHEKRSNQFV